MKSHEKPEIPVDICPICYNPIGTHAADCDYEKKVEHYNKSEGITPEFKADVQSGKITFERQIEEIKQFWENLKEPSPELKGNISKAYERISDDLKRWQTSWEKLCSLDSLVLKGLPSSEELVSLIINIGKVESSLKYYLDRIGEKELSEDIDEFKKLTSEYVGLVEEVTKKLNSLNL